MYLKNKNQASPGAAPVPTTPCYNIGDTGPAGGIIVSVPGVGLNTSNFYYEIPPTTFIHEATISNTNVDYSCDSASCGGATDPDDGIGVEFACWNQIITSQFGTNTSHEFGTGLQNTFNVISSSANSYQFYSNWDNAFNLADNYSLGGFGDWFLPSAEEIKEASDNGFNMNPGGSLPATSSGYTSTAYSSPINDQYPGLTDAKVFVTYKPSVGYTREVRGQDLTVIPMRRFPCISASWDCSASGCYDPGTGLGQYTSLSACQAVCETTDPVEPCFYNIGDEGPGGGIIFITPTSLPGQNFYYEIAKEDVITSNTTLAEFQEVPSYINPTYVNTPASPAGAEWGAYKSPISLSATGTSAGIGLGPSNTSTIVNHPQCPGFPCHPLIFNNYIAAALCTSHNGGGMSDWFLPSVFELQTLFFNSGALNDSLYPGNGQYALSGMHWTSSAVHDPGNPQIDGLAWAWDTDGWPVAHQGYRDKKLSVRPIRRFECPTITSDQYNYRDGYGATTNPWWQAPFTPGLAGSGSTISGNAIEQDCIGFPVFTIALALEDVLGNTYGEDSFNTINNPNGYFISIWDNDKNFLGKWKYETCEKETVKDNWLNFGNLTPNIPLGTAGVPRMVYLKLENPTHLEGQYPIVKYGGNNYNNSPQAYQAGVDYINHYDLDYESGTYLQFTSSYCFIKFECDVTNANNYEDVHTGPNTDPQLLNTICVGDRTLNSGGVNYRTSGRIGVGVGVFFANPKNNTNFNSVYGVPLSLNYQFGSYPDFSYDQPLHFIHPWFGSNPPDANLQSYGVQWFPDFLTAYNSGCISPENTGPLAPGINASKNNKPYIKKQTKCCGEK